jgi:hypothetical protein
VKGKRSIATIAGLAVIALAVIGFLPRTFSAKSVALAARQEAMEKLGESIAKLRPKCKVLVLSNPFTRNSGLLDKTAQFERAGLRGLRNGLRSDCSVTVVFPEIRPEYFSDPQSVVIPPDSRTPLSFLIRPGAVEQLADAHPECSVLVSLIGLPAGVEQGKIWKTGDPRSFALLLPDLRIVGPAQTVVEAYERGKLLAIVAEDASQAGKPLIVTRNNVREVLTRQPQALGY